MLLVSSFRKVLFVLSLATLLLTACERSAPTLPPAGPEPTNISSPTRAATTTAPTSAATSAVTRAATSVATSVATAVVTTPARTPVPSPAAPTVASTVAPPTATPVPAPPTATATQAPSGSTTTVTIFMIARDDNGKSGKKIGCNDSVVPVTRSVPRTQAVLTASLNELLSLRDEFYGQSGLTNALFRSRLTLDSLTLSGGKATIRLTGTLTLGGACDSPRVEAQLMETALQFATVREAAIFINGVPLKDALSSR